MRGGGIHIDDSELRTLQVDLSQAPLRVQWNASKTTLQGARLIQKDMKRIATGHRRLQHLAKTVNAEMLNPLLAEIGFDYEGQGMLAHIIVYGSVNNGPVFDHSAALRNMTPRVEAMYADAAEESVFGRKGTG